MMGSRNATEEDFAKVGRLMTEGKVTAVMMLTHRYDFKSLAEIYESDVINNRQLIKGVIHFSRKLMKTLNRQNFRDLSIRPVRFSSARAISCGHLLTGSWIC